MPEEVEPIHDRLRKYEKYYRNGVNNEFEKLQDKVEALSKVIEELTSVIEELKR